MLAKRIISGVFIALIATILIYFGGWIYAAGIALFLSIAVWEFATMFNHGGFHINSTLLAIISFIITTLRNLDHPLFYSASMVIGIFLICTTNVWKFKNHKDNAAINLAVELAAFAFIVFPGTFLIDIRNLPNGIYWVLVCMLPASLGDIGAYLIGSIFGNHRLAPSLSPQKSIEGYISGICFAGATGMILGFILHRTGKDISFLIPIIISLIIGIISPLGDLTKSIVKRSYSLKDTGNLIPGHGGMLDRIDTILWAAPITYFLFQLMVR